MSSFDMDEIRDIHPGKSDAEAIKAFADESDYGLIVRYKESRESREFTHIGAVRFKKDYRIYFSSSHCHFPEIVYEKGSPTGEPTLPFVLSEFASNLKCKHCHGQIAAKEWPLKGDETGFYTQKEPGNYSVAVTCPKCTKVTFVVWDENPGGFLPVQIA